MATLICELCPEVSLYVARLDERHSVGSGQRQITARSAADAIRWATDCGVDIISMSWTIETPLSGNKEMETFEKAVREAENKKILMFCSTSDQGSSTKEGCYPGDFGNGCVKIGAATDTGEALAWVDSKKVDFLLPGKNVPFTGNDGKVTSYESGSSVATAVASGLAGMLLFCSRLLPDKERPLQDHRNMRAAFKSMVYDGNQFPHVRDYFEVHFRQYLSRAAEADDPNYSKRPRSYDISKLTWNNHCKIALESVLSQIKLNIGVKF